MSKSSPINDHGSELPVCHHLVLLVLHLQPACHEPHLLFFQLSLFLSVLSIFLHCSPLWGCSAAPGYLPSRLRWEPGSSWGGRGGGWGAGGGGWLARRASGHSWTLQLRSLYHPALKLWCPLTVMTRRDCWWQVAPSVEVAAALVVSTTLSFTRPLLLFLLPDQPVGERSGPVPSMAAHTTHCWEALRPGWNCYLLTLTLKLPNHLKSSSMSSTFTIRLLESFSFNSSSLSLLDIMIVFLVIFSLGRSILRIQGSHWRKTLRTHMGITWVSAVLWW